MGQSEIRRAGDRVRIVCDHCGLQQAYFLREGDLMLFTDASYMPGGLSSPTRMNKMGLEQDNKMILQKKL